MKKRNIGKEILAGLKEISEFKQGKTRLRETEIATQSVPQRIRAQGSTA